MSIPVFGRIFEEEHMGRSRASARGRTAGWLLIAGLVAVLLAGAYSAIWFALAGRLESEAETRLARLGGQGVALRCAAPEARGFPFRIGIHCSSVEYARAGLTAVAGALRSTAPVHRPGRIAAELQPPLRVTPPDGPAVSALWQALGGELVMGPDGPERLSASGRQVEITAPAGPNGGTGAGRIVLAEPNLSASRHGRDLAVAFSTGEAVLAMPAGPAAPPMTLRGDIVLPGGARYLTARRAPAFPAELQSEIRSLRLAVDDNAWIAVEGPLRVGQDGLLAGRLAVRVMGAERLGAILGDLLPEYRPALENVRAMTAVLASGGTAGEAAPLELVLTIDEGRVSAGLIPLGRIAPLF